METLSELNKKCLKNLPMMLDVIVSTINNLHDVLNIVDGNLSSFIEEQQQTLPKLTATKSIYEGVEILSNNESKDILPFASYCLSKDVAYMYNRKKLMFHISFGYICELSQNVIFFQITDSSQSFITELFTDELKQRIPKQWRTGFVDGNSLFLEFDIDNTLNDDKIQDCASDFNKHVLLPVFNKLGQ